MWITTSQENFENLAKKKVCNINRQEYLSKTLVKLRRQTDYESNKPPNVAAVPSQARLTQCNPLHPLRSHK